MKKSFTLVEVLITVVVVTVLGALVLPHFARSTDKGRAKQAIAYLRVIRTSERMYHARNSNYLGCAPACTNQQIKDNFGAEVGETGYTFSITTPTTESFTATATASDGRTIILSEDGTWGGTAVEHIPTS